MDPSTPSPRLSRDFWLFWFGQTVSNLGNAITLFALPLLIFKQTGSALDLGVATTVTFLPYLLFGLLIGTWADRSNRKRLMIVSDGVRALFVGSIPAAIALGGFSIGWLYVVMFVNATLGICFNAAQTAALPRLVSGADLLVANGRIQASYSATTVLGPALAGVLVSLLPLDQLLLCDAATFLVSAATLSRIAVGFNSDEPQPRRKLSADVAEGLRYVLGHPVLRTIALMTGILSFTGGTITAQIVLFAKHQFQASDLQVSLFYSADGLGITLLALAAGFFRRYWTFSQVALGSAIIKGLMLIGIGLSPSLWVALPLWAVSEGLSILFSINSLSLRQQIVPNRLLGRVQTIGQVISWSAIPVGTFLGGLLIEATGQVALVYTAIGVVNLVIAVLFVFSPLARAEQFIPAQEQALAKP